MTNNKMANTCTSLYALAVADAILSNRVSCAHALSLWKESGHFLWDQVQGDVSISRHFVLQNWPKVQIILAVLVCENH